MENLILLPIDRDVRNTLPFYEDYAAVNRHIFNRLNERQQQDWKVIQAEELIAHAESVIDELMKKESCTTNHSVISTACDLLRR